MSHLPRAVALAAVVLCLAPTVLPAADDVAPPPFFAFDNVTGKAPDGDQQAVEVVREVARPFGGA